MQIDLDLDLARTPLLRSSVASKGTAGDAKCVTEMINPWADKNKKVKGGGKIYLFVSRENKRIHPIKQQTIYRWIDELRVIVTALIRSSAPRHYCDCG